MHSEAAFEATEAAQCDETISEGEFLVLCACHFIRYLFHFCLKLNASLV